MTQHPGYDKWRDLLRPSYDYPENLDDGMPGRAGRKRRRQAKKEWRQADHLAREEFIAQRRAEEVPPEARLGFAIFLTAIVVIAAIVVGIRSAGGNDPSPAAASASPAPETAAPSSASPTPSDTASPDVEEEQTPAPVTVEETVTAWATAWFTFTPTAGDDQAERMERAEPLMTRDLAAFLWTEDPVATSYEKTGTDVEPDRVKIKKTPKGAAPPDTDLRATRKVTIELTYTAGPDQGERIESVYLVTLLRDDDGEGWKISDYAGQEH